MPTSEAEVPNYMQLQEDLALRIITLQFERYFSCHGIWIGKDGHITGPPHILDPTLLDSFSGGI
jgi:hypothetical protein